MFDLIEPLMMLGQATGDAVNELETGDTTMADTITRPLVLAIVFSALGIGLLGSGFFILTKILPFSMRKEIEEDQNTSLAIIIGSFVLGISIIIAAAIMG